MLLGEREGPGSLSARRLQLLLYRLAHEVLHAPLPLDAVNLHALEERDRHARRQLHDRLSLAFVVFGMGGSIVPKLAGAAPYLRVLHRAYPR